MGSFRPWTDEETTQLTEMLAAGKSAREIADALGRTDRAVWVRASRIRASGGYMPSLIGSRIKTMDRKHMHPLMRKVFKKAITEGDTVPRMAKRSGLSEFTIRQWMRSNPLLPNFVALANAVGYRVVLVDDDGREAA